MKTKRTLLAWLIGMAATVAHGQTPVFNYTNFTSVAELALHGDAVRVSDRLRLTAASTNKVGGVWFGTKRFLQDGFETTFQFQITNAGGDGPGEGFAFVIQNNAVPALGPAGGGLGYGGVPNSLAVEFDTFANTNFTDAAANHISVQTRRSFPNSADHSASLGAATNNLPALADGNVHTAKIVYAAGALNVFVDDLTNAALSVPLELETVLSLDNGQAWFGFTAATGGAFESHDLLSWSFAVAQPSVNITGPVSGASFISPANIAMTTSASNTTVVRVEFFQGSTKLGEVTNAPFSFTWNNVPPGAYLLTVVATDDAGRKSTSPPVKVTVLPSVPPVGINFSTGNGGTNYPLGATDLTGVVPQRNWNNVQAPTNGTLTVDAAFIKITAGAIVNDGGASVGTSWADYDNDGWLDLFVANTLGQNDFLYHNNGNGTFTRITAGVVVNDGVSATGFTWGDYDNDGDLDLFVATPGNDLLYRNNGDGIFTRITDSIVATNGGTSSSPSWVDYDSDGDLDLYVSNNPGPKFLYRNDGNGTFTKVTNSILVTDSGNFAGSTWGDYDNDGDLDLFVCGAGNNSVLYRNDGAGNFTKITNGIFVNEGIGGFGSAWGDYDNDGWLDLFVCEGGLVGPAINFLYHNNGDGTFSKITNGAIVSDSGNWLRAAWGDYDNDSFLDLFVSNYAGNNALYHNNGNGTFTKITTGSVANDGGQSSGCGWGDYDNDGFLDLFVANGRDTSNENNFLYRNNGNSNSWIKLWLGGFPSNRSGVGAKVKINAIISGMNRWLTRSIDGSDVNGNASALIVGLGDATRIDTLRIEWPSGTVQEMHDVTVNQALTVLEATNGPPIFHTQPQSQWAVTHSNITLRTLVASLSPLTYQWQKDGVPVSNGTNSMLTISNAQISDGGSYVLAASNASGGTFSEPAVLTVAPLFLIAQPQSVIVRASSNTTFNITVLSGLPLMYQWRFNGTDVTNETNATFTITNAQMAHEGVYTVFIANSEDSATSQPATLVLYANPAVLQAPLSQTVVAGGNVTVSVVVTGNPPPFLYQWRRGIPVTGTLTNIVLHERTCFFTLFNVQTNQGGQYRVLITNAAFTALSIGAFFTLTVLPDANTNGLPDNWETAYGVTDSLEDADGDGMNNLQEYIAGTNPTNASSYLKIDQMTASGANTLQFIALSNKTYTVEFTEALGSGAWTRLADIFAHATNRTERVIDPGPCDRRYYRLVTPRQM